jgi:rRNA pseudouridine-1189 N-methylase Emg1 (Nep1/Mra1 family)
MYNFEPDIVSPHRRLLRTFNKYIGLVQDLLTRPTVKAS